MTDNLSPEPAQEPDAEPQQPAREARRPVHMPGVINLEDGTEIPISVVDLSYDGCGIGTPVPLNPEDTILISVRGRGNIHAEVRWYADHRAGLLFKAEDPQDQDGYVPRKGKRVEIPGEVTMRRAGKPDFMVRLTDASPTGCKVQFADRPKVDEPVLVKFDGLQLLGGTVRWIEGIHAGIAFDYPIHPAVFDLLVERHLEAMKGA